MQILPFFFHFRVGPFPWVPIFHFFFHFRVDPFPGVAIFPFFFHFSVDPFPGVQYFPSFLHFRVYPFPIGAIFSFFLSFLCKPSQRAHNVYTTSPQRRCNAMTLHRRCITVMCPLGFSQGKIFSFRIDRFSVGFWCTGKKTGSQMLSPLHTIADNLPTVFSPLRRRSTCASIHPVWLVFPRHSSDSQES